MKDSNNINCDIIIDLLVWYENIHDKFLNCDTLLKVQINYLILLFH